MNEYQYYEFQATDRPLTTTEQETIQALVRAGRQVTPPSGRYSSTTMGFSRQTWGSSWRKYFDCDVLHRQWGTWHVDVSLPQAVVNLSGSAPTRSMSHRAFHCPRKYVVFWTSPSEEEGVRWLGWKGKAGCPAPLPLRDDLLSGDMRLLYLAWLRLVTASGYYGSDLEDDPLEPPVPPN